MRRLLDAVRNHPSRMTLQWDQVPANDAMEISARFNTADMSFAKRDDNCQDIDRSLQNYVVGKGRWNKCLKMWFEDEEGDWNVVASEEEEE